MVAVFLLKPTMELDVAAVLFAAL